MEEAITNLNKSLAGRILIAPPGLQDSQFSASLTLILEHSSEGALGVIINRPSLTEVGEYFPEWEEMASPGFVFAGGPVDHDALIAIGRSDNHKGQLVLGAHSIDLDEQPLLVAATGIEEVRVFSGYAGWGVNQLEREIENNAWWLADATIDDLFTHDPANLWSTVLKRQGGDMQWFAHYPENASLN